MNWFDLLLMSIFLGAAYRGFRTGLLLSLVRFSGILVAFLIAAKYCDSLADFLEHQWHLADLLAAWLGQFLGPGHKVVATVSSAVAVSMSTTLPQTSFYTAARGFLTGAAFALLFVLTERLWYFAGTRLTIFRFWWPFLSLDRAGGLLLGAAWGFLGGAALVLLLLYAAHLYEPLRGPGNLLSRTLETSVLVPYFKGFLRAVGALLPAGWQKLLTPFTGVAYTC